MHGRTLALLLVLIVTGSPAGAAPIQSIKVRGDATGITVSPAGEVWAVSEIGGAYRINRAGRWEEVDLPARRIRRMGGDDLARVTFFDARRMMISGYIGAKADQILISSDKGVTWSRVTLPVSGRVYDVQAKSNGRAWMVGSSGDVLRSDDFGRTWRVLTRPFKPNERTMSVWFDSPQRGAVGSWLRGAVATTDDGGTTWRRFEPAGFDESRRTCPRQNDLGAMKVRFLSGKLLIEQCGAVFASPLEPRRRWSRVTANGKPLVTFEIRHGKIIGVDDESAVVELSSDGTSRVLFRPETRLGANQIAVAGDRVAILSRMGSVMRFDGTAWLTSELRYGSRELPMDTVDRAADGVLWGTSGYFLYSSWDGGRNWHRQEGELPVVPDRLIVQRDGDILMSDGRGWVGRWRATTRTLVDVPVLNGLAIAGSFRRADVWLVYGGRKNDSASRRVIAWTSGQSAGSVNHGFVAASRDGGVTWTVIDRWKEEGPQAAFLSDANRLTLRSWRGGIRQGLLTLEPLGAAMSTVVRANRAKKTDVPYVGRTSTIDLLDSPRGWISGEIPYVGPTTYTTMDDGRSWMRVDREQYPVERLERLYDGTWLGLVAPRALQRWNGKNFEPFVTLPPGWRNLWTDAQGELLVQLKDETLHVLDAKTRTFRALAAP